VADEHAGRHHASPTTYVVVFIALMVLALTTYLLGEGRLPREWSLPVAMLIAVVKAGLVLLFFMHLAEHGGAVRLTVVIAVVFIVLLIGFTVSDAATRYPATNPTGAPFGVERPRPSAARGHH
jgi:cytochrome c oxidase subunit 4